MDNPSAKIITMLNKDKFGLSLVKLPTRNIECKFEYEMITVDVTGNDAFTNYKL